MDSDVKTYQHGKMKLSPNGRVVIPAAVREQMGINPGDNLYWDFENGAFRIETYPARIARIQREIAPFIPPGVSLVDELIAERREEARREEEEFQRDLEQQRFRNEAKIA